MWASLGHYSAAHKPQVCTSFAVKSAEGTPGASQEMAASLPPSCPPSQADGNWRGPGAGPSVGADLGVAPLGQRTLTPRTPWRKGVTEDRGS